MNILSSLGQSLYAAAGMFWDMFWALILGFTLSGIVQTFVSKATLSRMLGRPGAKEIGLAAVFGALSSSCSYAAASMSRSLYQRGAHSIPAIVFMVASTNLVIELSLVLWQLMGWQFVAAEFAGGLVLIVFLTAFMRLFGLAAAFERHRAEFKNKDGDDKMSSAPNDHKADKAHVTSLESWQAAARAFVMEWQMIWKDIALGTLISGFLMVLVPEETWHALFSHVGGVVQSCLVGPLISVISFVCSVGNIPMANVLYGKGLSFGGTISFIYADLLIIPLILVYRKYYGWKLAMGLTSVLYLAIVCAGIVVDFAFQALYVVPERKPVTMASMHFFEINYTFWLNILFLVIATGLFWLSCQGPGSKNEAAACQHHHAT